MGEDDAAPGWDAIHAAVVEEVGVQEPLHWGTKALPNQDGVYGLSAYRAAGHWLLVTFGLTELYDKEFENPQSRSGSAAGCSMPSRRPARGPLDRDYCDPRRAPLHMGALRHRHVRRRLRK